MISIHEMLKNKLALFRGHYFKLNYIMMKKNVKIGSNFLLANSLGIKGPGTIEIGDGCLVSGVLGDKHRYVTLYTHCPEAKIKIGNNARIYGARISSRFAITIGVDVLVEHAGIADTDFHNIDRDRNKPPSECPEKSQIVIGDRAAIGSGSIVMKGVRIGNDAIILPGSVVTNSIPDLCVATGNPAKVIYSLPTTVN